MINNWKITHIEEWKDERENGKWLTRGHSSKEVKEEETSHASCMRQYGIYRVVNMCWEHHCIKYSATCVSPFISLSKSASFILRMLLTKTFIIHRMLCRQRLLLVIFSRCCSPKHSRFKRSMFSVRTLGRVNVYRMGSGEGECLA